MRRANRLLSSSPLPIGYLNGSLRKPDMNELNALIEAGIDLRYQDRDGGWETALIRAAENGHVEVVKALVAADPDPAHLNIRAQSRHRSVCLWCIKRVALLN